MMKLWLLVLKLDGICLDFKLWNTLFIYVMYLKIKYDLKIFLKSTTSALKTCLNDMLQFKGLQIPFEYNVCSQVLEIGSDKTHV